MDMPLSHARAVVIGGGAIGRGPVPCRGEASEARLCPRSRFAVAAARHPASPALPDDPKAERAQP